MPNNLDCWSINPEFIDLLNFLIEKTKDVKSTMSMKQLAGEFREKSGAPQSMNGVNHRIRSLLSRVHRIENIETDTKVKLMFALRTPVDSDFLETLKTQADVVLDDHQKIIKYSKKGGGLELISTYASTKMSKSSYSRDKRIEEFLVQKVMGVLYPITSRALAKEFRESTGCSGTIQSLETRIRLLKKHIIESPNFDQLTKLRLLFVSNASVSDSLLSILREDALVEVDHKNRITKYRANDGSLELTKSHVKPARKRPAWTSIDLDSDFSEIFDTVDSEKDTEERMDLDDYDQPSGRLNRSEASEISEDNDEKELEELASKKASTTPKLSEMEEKNESQNIETVTTKSERLSKRRILKDQEEEEENLYPSESSSIQWFNQNRKTDTNSSSKRINAVADLEPSMEIHIKTEMPIPIIDIKPDMAAHTSQFKFLESLKSLILFLDTPYLSRIRSKIHQKMNEGVVKLIPNDEILVAMEMCLVKIGNYSVVTPMNTKESCSLRDFFCYLKAVILSSKFDGLEGFLEKLKDKIEQLYLQDKRIPVSKIESVLGAMLNFIDV